LSQEKKKSWQFRAVDSGWNEGYIRADPKYPTSGEDMKIDRFVKTMLVVIAVLLALNCAAGLRGPADAQSSGAKFGYIHIGDLVNYRNDPYHLGREVYDLRNGNVWAFPRDDRGGPQGNPIYLGTFDFSALDKSVQK
jgi:hypothetical protein